MFDKYRQQLERCYKAYLKDTVSGLPFTPIILRGEKSKPATMADLQKNVALFLQYEKSESRGGWRIEWMDWSSKIVGRQKWVARVTVETEKDLLQLLQRHQETAAFKEQLQALLTWAPGIRAFLAAKPELILAYKTIWCDLQKVVDYLLSFDVSVQYIRSIPVPVHTKFIEMHKPLILSLLKCVAPHRFADDCVTLEQALALKMKPHLYTVRWLDKEMSQRLLHGMECTGVTGDWLRQINWPISEVWMVENETNLYLVPPRKNAMAIFSRGYAMSQLKDIPLFHKASLYYWGDLDEDGYKMLNGMRAGYPHIKSVFMDEYTLLKHAEELMTQQAKYKTAVLPLLTGAEQAAFNILKHHNGRLEQERIRQDFIVERLSQL